MEILLSALILYAGLVTWVCIVQFRRSENLEKILNRTLDCMQRISDTIQQSGQILQNDSLRAAFSNDDEVGTFFEGIQRIQEELNNYVMLEEDAEESE